MQGRALLATIALLGVLAGALLLFLRSRPAPRTAVDGPGARTVVVPGRDASPTTPLPVPDRAAASTESAAASEERASRRAVADGRREVRVQLALPAGAPPDPGLALVLCEAAELEGDDPAALLAERSDAERFAVSPDGSARVSLPAERSEPVLLLDGRFLFLDEPAPVPPDAAELRLEPTLGALVVVQLSAAAQGELRLSGADLSGRRGRRSFEARELPTGDDARVAFRAVDTGLAWTLMPRLEHHHADMRMGIELSPGQTLELPVRLTPGATLVGEVVDEAGAAVEGASVKTVSASPWFGDADVRATMTAADGSFELHAVAPGEQELSVSLEGWLTTTSDVFEVADGGRSERLRLVLARGEALSGRVVQPDGAPAAGAEVVVEAPRRRQGWGGFGGPRIRRAGRTTTDEAGRFAVPGLAEGSYTVRATLTADDAEDAPAWRTRLDGVAAPGPEVLLELVGPLPLRGRVVNDAGEPVTAFELRMEAAETPRFRESQRYDTADGSFLFARVGPGAWELEVRAEGHVQREPAEVVLPGADALELVVERTAGVSGVILDPFGAPVADARVRLDGGGAGGNPWMRATGPSATSDATGRFVLGELSPGTLALLAEAEGWADSLPLTLELQPGEERSEVTLALRAGGRIEGLVVTPEGDPLAGKRVTWGDNAMGFGSRGETTTDAAGRFAFDRVTPGEWAVSAAPSFAEMGERMRGRRDPSAFVEVMGELVTRTVAVVEGEVVEVFLGGEPKRPVRIFGSVTRGGRPVAEAQVFAVSESSAVFEGMKTARSAVDGSFELTVDRPGPYVVSAQLDRIGVELPVEVPRADETRVDLAIPEGGIAGRVEKPDGRPAAGVRVGLQREDGLGRLRWGGDQTTTEADGRFAFEALAAGVYTVRANVAGWGGSARTDLGTTIVQGIAVARDTVTTGIELELEEAGTLTGVVRGPAGAPLAGASVFFRAEGGAFVSTVSGTLTDATGRFERRGLAPGRYALRARADGVATPTEVTATVASGETTEVELAVDGATYVVVVLEDDDEQLRPGRVEVLDEDGRDVGGLFTLDELRAAFNEARAAEETRIGPFAPGRYTVRATLADGRSVERKVRLRARDDEKRVRLKL